MVHNLVHIPGLQGERGKVLRGGPHPGDKFPGLLQDVGVFDFAASGKVLVRANEGGRQAAGNAPESNANFYGPGPVLPSPAWDDYRLVGYHW